VVDFLLECIGFPPDQDTESLARRARDEGEAVVWRGPCGEHLRLPLGAGIELRMDREEGQSQWTLLPYFEASRGLRVAVKRVLIPGDSPYDALLLGRAHPPTRSAPDEPTPDAYDLACLLTDARRLPKQLEPGRVLAIAVAGFALDVTHVGARPTVSERPPIAPLRGAQDPGGCVEVRLQVLRVTAHENPVTRAAVAEVEVDAPGRALPFFLSPWQLERDRLPAPCAGMWIEGTFLLTGRIGGGLGGPSSRLGKRFG